MSDINVVRPKANLEAVLGSKCQKYWRTMRLWYKQQISKDQFDCVARELVGADNVYLHNEFVLALLIKCQQGPTAVKMPKVFEELQQQTPISRARPPSGPVLGGRAGLAQQDRVLPDVEILTSRCLTAAWEKDVDAVCSESVEAVHTALQMFMQGMLVKCLSLAKGHQLTEHKVPHNFNKCHPMLQNNQLPSLVTFKPHTKEESVELAQQKTNINLFHLKQVLLSLPSRKVGLLNAERAMLHLTTKTPNPHTQLNKRTVDQMYKHNTRQTPAHSDLSFKPPH